jgi:filamentous hemagglutinin
MLTKFISKTQRGFTLAELAIVTVITGVTAMYGMEYAENQERYANVEKAVQDLKALQHSYNQFYLEERRFPADIPEMVDLGYYVGDTVSPFNTTYIGEPGAKGFRFRIDANEDSYALTMSDIISGSTLSAATEVSVEVPIPTLGTIAAQYLHRVTVAGHPEYNSMQTNLDINGFDINSIGTLDAVSVETQTLNTDLAIIDTLNTIDTLKFGSNSISSQGTTLNINAEETRITGDLSVSGNITSAGQDILGFGKLSAINGEFTTLKTDLLDAQTATIDFTANVGNFTSASISNLDFDTAKGNSLELNEATIDTVTANRANFSNATLTNVNATNFNSTNANITNLTSTAINTESLNVTGPATIANANIVNFNSNTLTTNSLVANSGSINSLVVNSISAVNANLVNFQTDTLVAKNATVNLLNANSADFTTATFNSLNVLNDLIATNAKFNTLKASKINFTTLVGNAAEFNDLNVTGTLTAANANIGQGEFNSLSADSLTVTGNTVLNSFTANDLTLSNKLTTNNLKANNGNVSGTLTANNVVLNNLTMNSYSINNIGANTINAKNVNGQTFNGSNFYSSGDFNTGAGNSVNGNRARYNSIKALWDSCVASDGCN